MLLSLNAPALSGFGFNMVGPAMINTGLKAESRFVQRSEMRIYGFARVTRAAGRPDCEVATTAVKDGDEYIINGSKIWTSGAEDADWIFCLVRTNGQVQSRKGLVFFSDLRSRGSD